MTVWMSGMLLVISLAAIVLICLLMRGRRPAKIALLCVLAVCAAALAGYIVLSALFVDAVRTREPDDLPADISTAPETERKEPDAAEQIRKTAQSRVDAFIRTALGLRENNPLKGVSPACTPYEAAALSYDALSEAQKKLYDDMLPQVAAIEDFSYSAAEYGYAVLDDALMAMGAIREDYPQYAMYFYLMEVVEGDITTALRSYYFMPGDTDGVELRDKDALRRELTVFEEECSLIVDAIPESYSAADRYFYLAAYLSLRTRYDHNGVGGSQVGTAYGSIQGGYSICAGYAAGFEYLCRRADLWCRTVSGEAGGASHAWNLVQLDSGTYHIDVTWSDADGVQTGKGEWYQYFLLSQEEIERDHVLEEGPVADGASLWEAIAKG